MEIQQESDGKRSEPMMSLEPTPLRSDPRLVSSDDVKSAACVSKKRNSHQGRRNSSSHCHREYHEHGTVQHSYHDYSHITPEDENFFGSSLKEPHNGASIAFPVVLHRLLADATEEGFEHIISWQPHGRAFIVHDHERFVDQVMARYTRMSLYSSFQRQLSLYGFLRLTKGPDSGAYYNELFLRGLPHLCTHMQRTRVKGYGVRQSSSPETEPDFYTMDAVSPPRYQAGPLPALSVSSSFSPQASALPIDPFRLDNLDPIPVTIDNSFEEQEAMADFLSDVDLDDEDSFYLRQSYEGEERFAKIYKNIMQV